MNSGQRETCQKRPGGEKPHDGLTGNYKQFGVAAA